jgi:hypothetical protein
MTLILLLATATAQLLAADPADTKPYVSKDGRFSVVFPGKPDAKTTSAKTLDGDMEVHAFRLTGKDKTEYSVVYTDYPADKFKGADADKLLDQTRDGGVEATRAKVKETKPKGFDSARDLELEIAGVTSYSRLVLAKNRLYVVMAVPEGKAGADAAKKFVESFKLAEK